MTLNPQQFHATLNPSWAWGADGDQHSAEVAISHPTNPDHPINGRLSWSNDSEGALYLTSDSQYSVEGTHKTLSAAVTAFNKQHLPSARIVKKFKNADVQPLAQEIQSAGGYDNWKEQNQ